MGSPTASSFVTAIKVSSLPAVSFSSSSLVEVGVNCDYLIARRSTSGRVKELISALFVKDSASLTEIFRYGTITDNEEEQGSLRYLCVHRVWIVLYEVSNLGSLN